MPAEHPFSAAYSPRFICATDAWRDALARLEEGLGARERILLVTGDAGTGKTALVLEAGQRWGDRARVVCVTNPTLTRHELLEEIARRLGAEPPAGASKPQLLRCLEACLAEVARKSQVAVVVIEDAHQLADDAFDELRLLLNAEAQAHRPLELVFVGLPALAARLATPQLAAIGQRITAHCSLEPLSNKATRRYLYHRIEAVGGDPAQLFPRQAATEIHLRSQGVPRAINAIAAEAMRLASEAGSATVTVAHVRAAAGKPVTSAGAVPSKPLAPVVHAEVSVTMKRDVMTETPVPASVPQPPALQPGGSDPRVSEWVSRFVGSQGPPRIGSALGFGGADGFDSAPHTWDKSLDEAQPGEPREPGTSARSPENDSLPGDPGENSAPGLPKPAKPPLRLIVLDDLPGDLPAARAARGPMPPVRHHVQGGGGLLIAGSVFAVAALTTVLVLARGRDLLPRHASVAANMASQSAGSPAAALAIRSSAPRVEPLRPEPPLARTAPVPPASQATAGEALATRSPVAEVAARDSGGVAATSARQRLALDVGSYLDMDRARLERDHLIAQTGLQAWVIEAMEDGGETYRVVVGVFSSQDRADASATSLLERGLISEARVVPLPSRRARH